MRLTNPLLPHLALCFGLLAIPLPCSVTVLVPWSTSLSANQPTNQPTNHRLVVPANCWSLQPLSTKPKPPCQGTIVADKARNSSKRPGRPEHKTQARCGVSLRRTRLPGIFCLVACWLGGMILPHCPQVRTASRLVHGNCKIRREGEGDRSGDRVGTNFECPLQGRRILLFPHPSARSSILQISRFCPPRDDARGGHGPFCRHRHGPGDWLSAWVCGRGRSLVNNFLPCH